MKKLILGSMILLILATAGGAQAQESDGQITIHPSLIEVGNEQGRISVGLGLLETTGTAQRRWSVFPIRVALRAGENEIYLALNGLALVTRTGVILGRPVVVRGTRRRDVVSVGGPVNVEGTVEGSVWTFGADIALARAAVVTGDVVAIGGVINADRGSRIEGNKQALPALQIPFLGFLSSPQSAETLQFLIELFGVALFLLVLFIALHFRPGFMSVQTTVVASQWKANLLYLFVGLVTVPVLVAFLTASVVGVMLVPALFVVLMLATYLGFLGTMIRLGRIFIRNESDAPSALYMAGLLGFVMVRGPSLLGRLLSLLTSEAFLAIGAFLKTVGGIAFFLALVYGFGAGLTAVRSSAR
jgi:hypothetical protein